MINSLQSTTANQPHVASENPGVAAVLLLLRWLTGWYTYHTKEPCLWQPVQVMIHGDWRGFSKVYGRTAHWYDMTCFPHVCEKQGLESAKYKYGVSPSPASAVRVTKTTYTRQELHKHTIATSTSNTPGFPTPHTPTATNQQPTTARGAPCG